MDGGKLKAIHDWPTPTTLKGVHSFLGAIGFYRCFIKNYVSIAKPLMDLTKKVTSFVWSFQCQTTFTCLKELIITTPILVHPDPECSLILETNASNFAVDTTL